MIKNKGTISCIKNRKGQAIVELALILPILVLLIFGSMEFGRVFHSYINVTSAVREGARLGAVGGDNSEIEDRIRDALTLDESYLSIERIYPVSQDDRTPGTKLEIEILYESPLVVPLLETILPNPVPLRASATIRCE